MLPSKISEEKNVPVEDGLFSFSWYKFKFKGGNISRIGKGPCSDPPFLSDMKDEIDLGSKIVAADSGFYRVVGMRPLRYSDQ